MIRKGALDLILTSSLFDQAWYELVAGSRFRSRRAAVEDYLRHVDSGWSPHPLFEAAWIFPHEGWRGSSGDPLSHYLRTTARLRRSPHPLIDLERLTDPLTDPSSEKPSDGHDLGLVDRWLRAAGPETPLPVPAGARPLSWGDLRRALETAESTPVSTPLSAAVSVAGGGHQQATYAGRVSVVLPVGGVPGNTVGWIRSLFREHPEVDLEAIVCVTGRRDHRALATAVALGTPATRVLGLPPDTTWTEAANHGLAQASGETVVFLRASAEPTYWPWLDPLRRRLDEGIGTCQPLLLSADRTIAAAGASFVASVLDQAPLLRGHASADASRLPAGEIPAVSAVLACRAATARALGGFEVGMPTEHAEVDLSLRARRAGYRGAAVVPESVLIMRDVDRFALASGPSSAAIPAAPELAGASSAAWAAAGYDATPDPAEPHRLRVRARRLAKVTEGLPRLRWTIDIAAPGGPRGRLWGDRHFAGSLAEALERAGQHVTVDPRESRDRDTRGLDDVVLVIRGLERVMPRAEPLHILWVISHPEEVTAEECAGYGLVFAASNRWAASRSRAWDRPITPLLQCTDPERFNPGRSVPDSGPRVLFVGNSRGGPRSIVTAALEADCGLAMYGADWEDLVPTGTVVAEHVPNAELPRLYSSAGVVLNDHWPSMRIDGFISNRLFDAVACGARVVSDDIAGVTELFGGSVRVFQDPADLRRLVSDPWDVNFPDLETRLRTAEQVRASHSFDLRATQLIRAAATARAALGML